jgi:hypothetical protein
MLDLADIARDPAERLSFFDDFIGASYDNQAWSNTGATVTSQNSLGGSILVSGAGGYITHAGFGAFSAAQNVRCLWRAILTPGTGTAEVGLMNGAGAEWIAWITNAGVYRCQCGTPGGTTNFNSAVPVDSNNHFFEILVSPNLAQFFLDNALITAITTNVSALSLQPYTWLTGTGTSNADFVLVEGDR